MPTTDYPFSLTVGNTDGGTATSFYNNPSVTASTYWSTTTAPEWPSTGIITSATPLKWSYAPIYSKPAIKLSKRQRTAVAKAVADQIVDRYLETGKVGPDYLFSSGSFSSIKTFTVTYDET